MRLLRLSKESGLAISTSVVNERKYSTDVTNNFYNIMCGMNIEIV